MFLTRRLVLSRHIDDAVGINIEGHLNLRHAARARRNTNQIELAENFIIRSHLALTLENPDGHRRLIVFGGREGLRFSCRDRCVAVDQPSEHATQRLNAQRQRRDVQQQHVLDVALQHTALNGGADGHNLVRVDTLVGLAAEERFHRFLNLRHAGHATDQDHFVNFTGGQAGVFQGLLAGLDGALHQVFNQGFQLGPRQFDVEVFRSSLIGSDERQVHFRLRRR